jgi:hypothetical protein
MNDNDLILPPDNVPRFAYEEAEEHLDLYAARQDESFQRAYMKTKYMATAYAYGDFFTEGMHPELAMSRGWEELQIAFTGQGEAFLSGAVLHLWNMLPDHKAEKAFGRTVKKAFALAEKATPLKAVRLYMKEFRLSELRHPDDGFILEPVLPASGIRLREWALAEQMDADLVEEQFEWLERADRLGEDAVLEAAPIAQTARQMFQVLDGGLDSQGRPQD